MTKKIWVSDLVTDNDVHTWSKGDSITISAGTGVGKSHFIKNTLYNFAKLKNKKILFLIHRRNCVDQFQEEINRESKQDTIDIKTYQYIEAQYKKKQTFDFSPYEYVVVDEFHYFMSDASFSKTTDISLEIILKQTDKIKIFMSATGDYMKRYINAKKKIDTLDYEVPIRYDFIKSLSFYNSDKTLDKLVEEAIIQRKKTLIFVQSATRAYELYKKYKNYVMFNCGKSDKHYKYVNKDKVKDMLKNEKFDDLILVTTTCMDAGVNLKDSELTHIICDIKDTGTLIQCIGRKRIINEDDHVHICIKSISNQQLGGHQSQLNQKMKMAKFLKNNSPEELIKAYPRENDSWNIVYDDLLEGGGITKKVNDLMLFKCMLDYNEMDIIKSRGDFGYCKYIAETFGFYDEETYHYDYNIVEVDDHRMSLEEYLEENKGKRLYSKDEKDMLYEMVNLRNGKNNRLIKKFNTIAEYVKEEFDSKYILISKVDNDRKDENGEKNPYRGKTYVVIITE